MGLFKGGALRLFQTLLYALAFCCAGIVLGIYSYYLASLTHHNLGIARWKKAVEGISGAAVLYTIATTVLTCCLAGITFLSMLGLVLDICFVGGFIAIAIMTRHGASSCKGNVNTPLGSGLSNTQSSGSASLGLACRLNTAAFAVSIIAIFIFICTALMQLVLIRHHKKEKRFGPSPANNYTSGSGGRRRGMFGRKNKNAPSEAEKGVIGTQGHPANGADIRPSHDTTYTGNTAVGAAPTAIQKDTAHGDHAPHVGWNPHTDGAHAPHGSHGGYYTSPQGTANPYGYDNTNTTTGVARDF